MSILTRPISAEEINKLRQVTGAGMMDCRKALTETNGDFENAIDWLRKQGQKIAAKRSDREAKEGVVIACTSPDHKKGYLVCLNCETDFVSKNTEFVALAQSIAKVAVDMDVKTMDDLQQQKINGVLISNIIHDKLASIGEKISISKFNRIEAPYVASYIHGAYRMGVLVAMSELTSEEGGKNIAMQIAAMNPIAIDAQSVPAEVIDRERNIVMDTMKQDPNMLNKTHEMIVKIAEGKLNAFFKEQTLLAQAFVKDSNLTMATYIKTLSPTLKVLSFTRVSLG